MQACPTGAMHSIKVEDSEMQSLAKSEELEVLRPELTAKPRVYYKNLYRFSEYFVGGSVAVDRNGTLDCLPGAEVALLRGGARIAEQRTDAFGDFKFDRLEPASGAYAVEIAHPGHEKKTIEVQLGESQYLGTTYLK